MNEKIEIRPIVVNRKPPSHRLRNLAVQIKQAKQTNAADVIELGKLLLKAKKLIDHGSFLPWLERNTIISRRTAQRAMTAAKNIVAPPEFLRKCDASTIQILSRKKVAKSKKLMDKALQTAPDHRGRIGYTDLLSSLSWLEPAIAHNIQLAKEGPLEALGRQLVKVANGGEVNSLLIQFEREPDELPQVAITALGSKTTSVSRCTVEAAFATLTGEEVRQKCGSCGIDRLANMYSKSSHYCKICERSRVKAAKKKRKLKEKEAAAARASNN